MIGVMSYAQVDTVNLKVYAVCSTMAELTGKIITIKFEVDLNKCDPKTGFVSMEEKLFHFEESLRTKGIDFDRFDRSFNSRVSKTHEYEVFSFSGTEQEIEDVIEIVKDQEVSINSIKSTFEEKNLEDQDDSAICALQKAIDKAEYIAKSLGYEHCTLRSVDDETSGGGYSDLAMLLATMSISDVLSGSSSYSIIGYFDMY